MTTPCIVQRAECCGPIDLHVERALLVHAGAIGDFVMSLRIVAALRQAGARRVTVLGRPEIARLAIPGGGVDDVLDIETGGYHALFTANGPLPSRVGESLRGIDLAVNMMAGGKGYVGQRLREAGVCRVIDVDPNPRSDWRGHLSDQWIAEMRTAGIMVCGANPAIRVDAVQKAEGTRRLAETTRRESGPWAILHPGSGSRSKCWPANHFAELSTMLRNRKWGVAFLLGPAEIEKMSGAELELIASQAAVIRNQRLRDLPGLLAACDTFVGNDSGVSHLAAAVGVRTTAIFGPTDPTRWAPLGENVIALRWGSAGQWPSVDDVLRITVDGPEPRAETQDAD